MGKLSTSEIRELPIDDLIAYVEQHIPQVYLDFNNFHLHFLPNGHRCTVRSLGKWNMKITSPEHYKHSDVATNQTYEEFYQVLDHVVEEISDMTFPDFIEMLMEIVTLRRNSKGFTKKQKQRTISRFFELLNPIRERLYALGYNWDDLCR